MLVSTMTPQEISNELLNDLLTVERKAKVHRNLLFKQMLRKRLEREMCTISYKTPKNNEWNIIFQLYTGHSRTAYYVKSRDSNGTIVYSVQFFNHGDEHEERCIIKYTTHFLQRYNERMELGFGELSKVIKYFFRNNLEMEMGQSQQLDDGTRCTQFIFPDGIGLGWRDESARITCLKTFVANSTLTKTQQNMAHCIKNDLGFTTTIQPYHLVNKF